MTVDVLAEESRIRLACFLTVLLAMNAWEFLAPRRKWMVRKPPRLISNYVLAIFNTFAIRALLPVSAVSASLWAERHGWGLLHLAEWPSGVEIVLTVLLLDAAIYGQHVLFHCVPLFWRIHKVHHADPDLDVSSGLRFHTIEILLSMLIKIGLILILGLAAWGVIAFEVILNATSMFNHSNARMPLGLDRLLRLIVVTPDMHRVHHSVIRKETDSNFGFNLPWWDRLFGTYRDQPEAGHEKMTIGLPEYRDEKVSTRLIAMLAIPFQSNPQTSDPPEPEAESREG
ncbi:MAG TPA: sterol desaturase family protein [Planctomycetaceae bacterium]|nr:sterol desaturase family protein [Planctomycetaceae bacterium]